MTEGRLFLCSSSHLWEEDSTGLQEFNNDLRRIGETQAATLDVFSLGTKELKAYRDEIEKNSRATREEEKRLNALALSGGNVTRAEQERVTAMREVRTAQDRIIETLDKEIELRSESIERSDAWAESGAAAAQSRAEAEEAAAESRAEAEEAASERIKGAIQSVEQEQLSAYDSMRQAAYDKATADEAAFSIDTWLAYVEETRAAADEYRANIQGMQLTPDEWANLLALPEEARTSIVNSYATSGEEGRARIRAALGDGGAGEAGAQATVAFDENFNPTANVEPTVDITKAEAAVKELTRDREITIKVKVDRSEYDDWDLEPKTGLVVAAVDKRPWNDWLPQPKRGRVVAAPERAGMSLE